MVYGIDENENTTELSVALCAYSSKNININK